MNPLNVKRFELLSNTRTLYVRYKRAPPTHKNLGSVFGVCIAPKLIASWPKETPNKNIKLEIQHQIRTHSHTHNSILTQVFCASTQIGNWMNCPICPLRLTPPPLLPRFQAKNGNSNHKPHCSAILLLIRAPKLPSTLDAPSQCPVHVRVITTESKWTKLRVPVLWPAEKLVSISFVLAKAWHSFLVRRPYPPSPLLIKYAANPI